MDGEYPTTETPGAETGGASSEPGAGADNLGASAVAGDPSADRGGDHRGSAVPAKPDWVITSNWAWEVIWREVERIRALTFEGGELFTEAELRAIVEDEVRKTIRETTSRYVLLGLQGRLGP